MSKKYFSPEEREKAEVFRRVKRIVALHHMTEYAILESMKKLVLPKSEGNALDEFFSEKAAGEIVDYNAGKGQKTLLIYVSAPDEEAHEIAIDMKDLGLIPIVPQLVWPAKFFGDSEEARKLQLKLRVGLMEYCDAIWVFRNGKDTDEMTDEILNARLLHKPIHVIEIPPEKE